MQPTAALLVLVLCSAPGVLALGAFRPAWAGPAAAALALASASGLVAVFALQSGGPAVLVDVAWLPALGSRLTLVLDGLGFLHGLLACGIGALVLYYSLAYLPRHLSEENRQAREGVRFYAWLLAFMASMLVLVTARDLLVLYVALDFTALSSFFLIRFDHEQSAARRAAWLALVLTTGSSLVFLTGALLVSLELGTFSIDAAIARARPEPILQVAAAAMAAGVLAKSAAFPVHFWLPRAMVAPTPVSSYLHSAAMVAAGVFVLQRLRPFISISPAVLDALSIVALASIAVGSALALVSDELKRILAYSTIAQYGYVMFLIASPGDAAAAGAPLYVFVHGLCKSALFMTAGTVTLVTGNDRLSATGGLRRSLPMLAAASGAAVAGLAGLPLTAGYFSDELFFEGSRAGGSWRAAAATVAATLTLAYAARFWFGIFGGRVTPRTETPAGPLVRPVVLLAILIVAFGVWPGPLAWLARSAGAVVAGQPIHVELSYALPTPHSASALACAAWIFGLALFATRQRWTPVLAASAARAGRWLAPEHAGRALAKSLARLSDVLHEVEVRDLRDRVGAIIVPTAAFVVIGLVTSAELLVLPAAAMTPTDALVFGALAVATLGACIAARATDHFAVVVLISFVGFSLAFVFALIAAPDVALVAVLIETTFTLLFLVVLAQLAPRVLAQARSEAFRSRKRDLILSTVAGALVGIVAFAALAADRGSSAAQAHVQLAQSAHAKDVVTAILADFRGLDTLGEISVLTVAMLSILGIHWEREP
jgi:multicomponent Na+:H+ antiporter subunit A